MNRQPASGVRTSAVVGEHHGLLQGITLLLPPLTAYRVFQVPMDEWSQLSLDPGELLAGPSRILAGLSERFADCPSWEDRFALLDRVLAARRADAPLPSSEAVWAVDEPHRTAGQVRIQQLATEIGWSARHLERRFRQQVGPGPKALGQVLQVQHALKRQEAGLSWSRVAAEAGFHDESHFDRTFKRMMGCTPSRFRSDRAARPDTTPLDFVPGQVTSALL